MSKDEALKLALEALVLNNAEWKALADSGDAGFWEAEEQDHYKQTEQAITAIKEVLADPSPNFNCKSVQARLATAWGFVKAQPEQEQLMSDQINYGMSVTQGGKRIDPMSIYKEPEQEPVATIQKDWKLMPRKANEAMLKAMDECSTEGYDERLYAGHAASVYMAAWDALPEPKQEQEPVVWMYQDKSTHEVRFQKHMRDFVDHSKTSEVPLYSEPLANHELQCVCGAVWCGDEMVHLPNKAPPQRKPLTDEEIKAMYIEKNWYEMAHAFTWGAAEVVARAIEAAHGIKGEA